MRAHGADAHVADLKKKAPLRLDKQRSRSKQNSISILMNKCTPELQTNGAAASVDLPFRAVCPRFDRSPETKQKHTVQY